MFLVILKRFCTKYSVILINLVNFQKHDTLCQGNVQMSWSFKVNFSRKESSEGLSDHIVRSWHFFQPNLMIMHHVHSSSAETWILMIIITWWLALSLRTVFDQVVTARDYQIDKFHYKIIMCRIVSVRLLQRDYRSRFQFH